MIEAANLFALVHSLGVLPEHEDIKSFYNALVFRKQSELLLVRCMILTVHDPPPELRAIVWPILQSTDSPVRGWVANTTLRDWILSTSHPLEGLFVFLAKRFNGLTFKGRAMASGSISTSREDNKRIWRLTFLRVGREGVSWRAEPGTTKEGVLQFFQTSRSLVRSLFGTEREALYASRFTDAEEGLWKPDLGEDDWVRLSRVLLPIKGLKKREIFVSDAFLNRVLLQVFQVEVHSGVIREQDARERSELSRQLSYRLCWYAHLRGMRTLQRFISARFLSPNICLAPIFASPRVAARKIYNTFKRSPRSLKQFGRMFGGVQYVTKRERDLFSGYVLNTDVYGLGLDEAKCVTYFSSACFKTDVASFVAASVAFATTLNICYKTDRGAVALDNSKNSGPYHPLRRKRMPDGGIHWTCCFTDLPIAKENLNKIFKTTEELEEYLGVASKNSLLASSNTFNSEQQVEEVETFNPLHGGWRSLLDYDKFYRGEMTVNKVGVEQLIWGVDKKQVSLRELVFLGLPVPRTTHSAPGYNITVKGMKNPRAFYAENKRVYDSILRRVLCENYGVTPYTSYNQAVHVTKDSSLATMASEKDRRFFFRTLVRSLHFFLQDQGGFIDSVIKNIAHSLDMSPTQVGVMRMGLHYTNDTKTIRTYKFSPPIDSMRFVFPEILARRAPFMSSLMRPSRPPCTAEALADWLFTSKMMLLASCRLNGSVYAGDIYNPYLTPKVLATWHRRGNGKGWTRTGGNNVVAEASVPMGSLEDALWGMNLPLDPKPWFVAVTYIRGGVYQRAAVGVKHSTQQVLIFDPARSPELTSYVNAALDDSAPEAVRGYERVPIPLDDVWKCSSRLIYAFSLCFPVDSTSVIRKRFQTDRTTLEAYATEWSERLYKIAQVAILNYQADFVRKLSSDRKRSIYGTWKETEKNGEEQEEVGIENKDMRLDAR
jgi:hypothetical protein